MRLSRSRERAEGYIVVKAEDGGTAIELLRDHRPPPNPLCLVILDLTLPVADDVQVLRALASHGTSVPVVAMSADGARRLDDAAPLLAVRSSDGDEILIPYAKAFLVALQIELQRRDSAFGRHFAEALGDDELVVDEGERGVVAEEQDGARGLSEFNE